MLRALSTAATGMDAQARKIDTIANNISNSATPGFKKARTEFQDLFYDVESSPTISADGTSNASSVSIGLGVKLSAVTRVFTQGSLNATNVMTDLAIEGEGFFQVELPDGTPAFTRDGALRVNADGLLATVDGYPLMPEIEIPQEAAGFMIDRDGVVQAIMTDGTTSEVARLSLVRFNNAPALEPMGRNLYRETALSGEAEELAPGTEGAGTIAQGFLEGSNVNVAEELVSMISAQRAYELTARVLNAADEMLQRAANLR